MDEHSTCFGGGAQVSYNRIVGPLLVGPEADFQGSTTISKINGGEGRFSYRWSGKLVYLYLGSPDTPLSAPAATSINWRSIGNLLRVGHNCQF